MAANEDRVRDSEEPVKIPASTDPEEQSGAPAKKDGGVTLDAYDQVKHTRSASLWSGLVGGAVILLVLLAFIVQNQQNTQINLLFWEANLPLGVSLLIAAILGALVVGSAGGLRIFQLRRAAKKLRD
ncbi:MULTISPECIES: LapA family protein [Tsukamurella]|uniref:Lipopolysaccharide assembly protein LapA domain-containing protein n=1 Tax=Tsukamurella strandjordii TaxID=147577 RepID=A0AA90SQG8_9ACTN|nr:MULTISPECIES: lipopolysaccharide assembly protein LapA domain-containing protein [Tsukamurella]MDP0397851.1 lipopolysaccharide assembly protein LapA domain-containing protein [Tsukamurella strandjordii]GIZ99295.1 hypothetical protein TTY48_39070 [Tsukamurella sp. TY48]